MTSPASPWYQAFFGEDYLKVYGHLFTDERSAEEADFVVRALGLQPGQQVLDLCCGQGRHAVALAARGLSVTGLDLAAPYLELAQQRAASQSVKLQTVAADMREIPFTAHFDAIINMFSAFGYLESEAEDQRVLNAAATALKPGGQLFIDVINREWVVRNQTEQDWHRGADGAYYLEHRELDLAASRNHVRFTIVTPDGSQRESPGHHIRLYTLTELIRMLNTAGLAFSRAYGGFAGEPYDVAARRMIVVARKG